MSQQGERKRNFGERLFVGVVVVKGVSFFGVDVFSRSEKKRL